MNGFGWEGGDEKRKIQWVAWVILCKSKQEGGWGSATFSLSMTLSWGNNVGELLPMEGALWQEH